MFSKATVVLFLSAVVLSTAVPPALRPAPLPVEELLNMPRAQAVALLKDVLRGPLEAAIAPAIDAPTMYGLIDDQIIQRLEQLRIIMREGSESLGLPVLDPLTVSHVEAHTHQKLIDFDGALDEFVISGLSDYVIDNIKFNTLLLNFNFGVTMPKVLVQGRYDADAILGGLLPIYGTGPFEVEVGDIVVTGKVKLALRNIIHIYIKSMDLTASVGSYHSEIDGLLGGGDLSDLINEVINDLIPEIIDANIDAAVNLISDTIVTVINDFLGEMTLQDLLDLIAGGKS